MLFVVPEGNLQRTFKTILCIFLLSALISPLSDIDISSIKSSEAESEYHFENEEMNGLSEEYIENKVMDSIKEILEQDGLSYQDIFLEINILENKSIDISKFVLYFDYLEDPSGTAQKIQQKTGLEPEIIITGEK